ncbi:MAG: hypothetical protein M3237_02210 [Actinomycetota bacterium]|nr:hypothetical protein [Actinomycetota bacterium]
MAATAIAALAVTGIPALASTAHAAVGSVAVAGVNSFTAFDVDELAVADDIIVTIKETGGTPSPAGTAVEYNFVRTNEAGVAQPASGWLPGGSTTDATGVMKLGFAPDGLGTYVLQVRTVGSQIAATPFTFVVGESEITWADGTSASSPLNGSDTYTGTLALTNAAKTPLPQRAVAIEYTGTDANFGPQTAPSVRVDANSATSSTAADGKFSVSMTDPVTNPAVAETGLLAADASLLNAGDLNAAADAYDELTVNFETPPVVKAVTIDDANVFGGPAAPGKPVELEITVTSEGPTPAAGDDIVLKDIPVSVAVDKGFLSPDSKPGLNTGINDLALAAGQGDEGDLFGFYEDLGTTETVDTSDDQVDNAAGIIATMAKDAGFNDDGLVNQTVTVTAGGKTATETFTYDVRNYLNIPATALRRDGTPAGNVQVPGAVDFKLYAADQFQNLVGDQFATVTDNTPDAKVVTEAFGATTDFINDNPSVTASATTPVNQVITATVNTDENLVDATGNLDNGNKVVTTTAAVNWVKAGVPPTAIVAKLIGKNNGGKADGLTVVTSKQANGATVKLFKIVGGKLRSAGTTVLTNGRASFKKADMNGNAFTTYIARVQKTSDTKGARTNKRNVR